MRSDSSMSKEIIKKHKNKNEYLLISHSLWVRNFVKVAHPVDINKLINEKDYKLLTENELTVSAMRVAKIDAETIRKNKVIIISDGYKFDENIEILSKLPRDVTVIGTNRSLAKWKRLRMDYFVVNNPYRECMSYLPNSYFPTCIASSRTLPDFIHHYRMKRGVVYQYNATRQVQYSGIDLGVLYYIDDYRNPICAAIGLAYRFGVQKLLLLCCDDAFEDNRSGSMKLHNGLHMYPQHEISHGLIEGNLYWLKRQPYHEVKIGNCSHGPKYKEIPYINNEDIVEFFR